MKHPMFKVLLLLIGVLPGQVAFCAGGFSLADYLNREWRNELVEFPLSPEQLAQAREGKVLNDPAGKPVPYQMIPGKDGTPDKIAFIADLDPLQKKSYQFGAQAALKTEGIQVEETPELIRVSNGVTGISIRRQVTVEQGPVAGILLKSGKWVGGSSFDAGMAPVAWEVSVVAKGPVFVDVEGKARFANGGEWQVRFRVQANEPTVLVDESYSVAGGTAWFFSLGNGFDPEALFYRDGKKNSAVDVVYFKDIPQPGPLFDFEPWTHWWNARNGKWFSVFNDRESDLVMFGARDSDVWVDPAKRDPAGPGIDMIMKNETASLQLPIREGRRRWMIGVFDKEASMAFFKTEDKRRAPLPQLYLIKNEFPLNRVKDYVLKWDGEDRHPNLVASQKLLDEIKQKFPGPLPPEEFEKLSGAGQIAYALSGNDPELLKTYVKQGMSLMQSTVDAYLFQVDPYSLGSNPHHQYTIQDTPNLIDAYMALGQLTPEQIERARALAAFLGYALSRPDYWSPERGFGANPNMTTKVAMHRAVIGMFLSSHPMSQEWIKNGLSELERQLAEWSDDNGGWLECPHYAMVSYDLLMGAFLMAHNSGNGEMLFDPRMKSVLHWFAKISTPPDRQFHNLRHLPAIGNTTRNATLGQFGIMAYLWKDKDPEFASQLQWMHRQQGSPTWGHTGSLSIFREFLNDPTIPEKAPPYGSELFPDTGVVMRNNFPGDRETMLYLIAGDHYEHYDFDSGAITIWGKGSAIADDFGYEGRQPVSQQSMVESSVMGSLMHVKDFFTSPAMDYTRGVSGGWTRQIVFMKDKDPLGASYFVINDSLSEVPVQRATWRMWLATKDIKIDGSRATVIGDEDVDTDIQFLLPVRLELKTESRTGSGGAVTPNGRQTGATYTLLGLFANARKADVFNALVYPRLKSQKPPVTTPLAGGKGVKVESEGGTDYVFVSAAPFTYKEGDVAFEGTVGTIQIRSGRRILSLGAPGSISLKEEMLKSDKADSREF